MGFCGDFLGSLLWLYQTSEGFAWSLTFVTKSFARTLCYDSSAVRNFKELRAGLVTTETCALSQELCREARLSVHGIAWLRARVGGHCEIARSLGEGLVSGRRPYYKSVWAAQSQLSAWFDGCNALL